MEPIPDHPDTAVEAAGLVFGLSGVLKNSWRKLTAADRDRLLGDLMANAAWLRSSLASAAARRAGPSEDDVRAELATPTSEIHLQPIVWLPTAEVVGYEALSRFAGHSPDTWFRRAWEIGIGLDFEMSSIGRTLPLLARLPDYAYLSINVSPLALISGELPALIGGDASRIVLELTEHDPIADYDIYHDRIGKLRAAGARIAIDDAGSGHSSLQRIVQLGPDIIKLDQTLTCDCDTDPVRRALMACFATFANSTRTSLVAEGVETAGEAAALISYGVAYGQGYYFAPPQRDPVVPARALGKA